MNTSASKIHSTENARNWQYPLARRAGTIVPEIPQIGYNVQHGRFRTPRNLPAALEIAFLAESFAGDVLECQTQLGVEGVGCVFIQSLRRVSDGRELARLRSRWQRADRQPGTTMRRKVIG